MAPPRPAPTLPVKSYPHDPPGAAPIATLTLANPVTAPTRTVELRLPARKAYYPAILSHSQQFGAAVHTKDIIDKRRCNRRPEYNRRGPHEDEA